VDFNATGSTIIASISTFGNSTDSGRRLENRFLMISEEERRLFPLVAKFGCVDLRSLRVALRKARDFSVYKPHKGQFEQLFVYYYLKETDRDGDEPMQDASSP
jgi:hypothetical protein